MNMSCPCWCWLWSPDWGLFIRFLHDKVTLSIQHYLLYSLEGSYYAELVIREGVLLLHLLEDGVSGRNLGFFCTGSLSQPHFFFSIVYVCQWFNMDSWILILYFGLQCNTKSVFFAWHSPALAIRRSFSWHLCLFDTLLLLVSLFLSLFAFQFVKFLLTYFQDHWFFPLVSSLLTQFTQKNFSILPQCFWFLTFLLTLF